MPSDKLLRDPIHDLIIFDLECEEDRVLLRAIDTREVQRLRRIKQLGMAHMAFHGAEHSRFSHSVGVMHLVKRMIDRLGRGQEIDPQWRLATLCAGLLHDIGHGPFSHVMEKFFKTHHEEWTERIILDRSSEINKVLRDSSVDLPERVVEVLRGRPEPRWLKGVISSQLDADRFDYLMRDSHMTGVKYGIFDLERLLLLMRIDRDGERIVVSSKGTLPLERYLQSRYQMYRLVYFHKTVTAAEAMLMMVLNRARDLAAEGALEFVDERAPLGKLLHQSADFDIEDFLSLDDSVLWSAMAMWARGGDETLADLSSRLLNRRIFKSVEIAGGDDEDMLFGSRITQAREFLEAAGYDFRYYLTFSKSADAPYRPYSPRKGESTIWVQDAADPNQLRDVVEVSPTIRAFTEPYMIHRAFFPDYAGATDIRPDLTRILRD